MDLLSDDIKIRLIDLLWPINLLWEKCDLHSPGIELELNRCFTATHEITSAIIHLPNDVTVSPVHSVCNLGVIFNSNFTFTQHFSAVSKSYLYHICDLRHTCNTFDCTTSCSVATSLIHSELDNCNSHLLNLSSTQASCLQLVLNAAVHTVTKSRIIRSFLFLHLMFGKKNREFNSKFVCHI
jgi:hypothetical protein